MRTSASGVLASLKFDFRLAPYPLVPRDCLVGSFTSQFNARRLQNSAPMDPVALSHEPSLAVQALSNSKSKGCRYYGSTTVVAGFGA